MFLSASSSLSWTVRHLEMGDKNYTIIPIWYLSIYYSSMKANTLATITTKIYYSGQVWFLLVLLLLKIKTLVQIKACMIDCKTRAEL